MSSVQQQRRIPRFPNVLLPSIQWGCAAIRPLTRNWWWNFRNAIAAPSVLMIKRPTNFTGLTGRKHGHFETKSYWNNYQLKKNEHLLTLFKGNWYIQSSATITRATITRMPVLTRSILGPQTAPTCPHDHPRVAQHMGYGCEIIAVWSATAAMTPLCSHTNGIKQRYPTCWLCQYSRFMIDLRSNTLIIHLRCSENSINRPIWLPDARMLKTISVAIKLT